MSSPSDPRWMRRSGGGIARRRGAIVSAGFNAAGEKRFIEEVRGDDPELASYLRIEERELEVGGVN